MEDRFPASEDLAAFMAAQDLPFGFPAYNIVYVSNLDDNIIGTFGQDMIFAAGGADAVTGGGNSDILDGESGNDTIKGGDGTDTFVYFAHNSNGKDAIEDFEYGTDVLRLADVVDENDDSVTVGASADGDILISFAGGGSVELDGHANIGVENLFELANVITVEIG
jgi:Ca2+-binding RTX toxin-like protein